MSPAADLPADDLLRQVEAANAAFYAAFESADLTAMERLWEHSERVVCTHPGWPTLRGWPAVRESWVQLLDGPARLQFVLTATSIVVDGPIAWVTLDENLLGGSGGTGGTVAALNLFGAADGGWRMLAHHGSPVVAAPR